MLPAPKNYSICPAVYPADRESRVTILPNERAFLFFDGEEYTVSINGVNEDVPYRAVPDHRKDLTVRAEGGVLRFNYSFSGEQEHVVRVIYNGNEVSTFAVYSLYEDLYCRIPLRGDLHVHSYRSDGRRDPAALLGHYREQGYDFTTLSDHNRYYPGGEIDEVYSGVRLGITHIQGEELHVPGTPIHIVGVGHDCSVAEVYIENSEEYQREMAEYKEAAVEAVPAKYADRYAMAKWVSDKVRAAGGTVIFPHPYWIPGDSKAFNVCDELSVLLLKSGLFDAFEVIGGISPKRNNRQLALWGDVRAEGVRIPVVGSSDVHALQGASSFPNNFTVCFADSNSESDILSAVKDGWSVAAEGQGNEYDRKYRAYGSLRLVSYAGFLLDNYFPELQRVCQGEGIAMRYYAMGMSDKSVIEGQVEQTEKFKNIFFGREEPILPDADMIAFENKARERHLQGPVTKGSTIYSDKVSRQI